MIFGVIELGSLRFVRCEVYVCDIIYGIVKEFGFDFFCDCLCLLMGGEEFVFVVVVIELSW